MSAKAKAMSEGKRSRILLDAVRAAIWFLSGWFLEVGTSLLADALNKVIARFNILIIVGIAIIAYFVNYIKARNSHPIYSMDNDINAGLFVLFAVLGSFVDNFGEGWVISKLFPGGPEIIEYITKYITVGVVLIVLAAAFMLMDVLFIDRWYENVDRISVEFQYKPKKGENYRRTVLRVNAAWIVMPVIALIICIIWICLVVCR